MSAVPPPLPALPRGGWWDRHWKAALVVGAVVAVLVFATFFVGIVALVHASISGSDAYRGALAAARVDARVRETLGTPIRDGWWTTGSISTGGDRGHARLSIPLDGPRGHAQLEVEAEREAGRWHYARLVAVTPRGTIDLAP